MRKYYICNNEDNELVYGYINYDRINGFKVKPRNNIKYDGIEVSKLILIKPNLIEYVLKRKIKIKLNNYLNFLISIIEDDSDDGDLTLVLDDIKRYRTIIMNKYSKYLNKKYIIELLYKVKFIEEELKAKIYEQEILNKSNVSRRGR